MSHQFDLFPPPPPRKERGLRTLSLYYPWSRMLVLYKLDQPSKASKQRWSTSDLRLHNEPDKTNGK